MISKKHKVASAAFTAVATAGLTGFGAGAANAASGPWTVTPGGTFHAHNITPAVLVDHTKSTHPSINCPVSTVHVTGTAKTGGGLSGKSLAAISNATFGSISPASHQCTGPAGLHFTAHGSQYPWHLNAVSSTAGTVFGTITGIHAVVVSTGGICSFHVSGAVSASYTNPTSKNPKGTLKVISGSGLTIKSVHNCLNVVSNGDLAGFHGSFSVFSNAQTITHS
jgi:hypothetical protein